VPAFDVTITETLVLDLDEERRREQLDAVEAWVSEQGHKRRADAPAKGTIVVAESSSLVAPSLSDAQRMAERAFSVRAFDARLPAGPRRIVVDVALSD
jgi:hypothetical protein